MRVFTPAKMLLMSCVLLLSATCHNAEQDRILAHSGDYQISKKMVSDFIYVGEHIAREKFSMQAREKIRQREIEKFSYDPAGSVAKLAEFQQLAIEMRSSSSKTERRHSADEHFEALIADVLHEMHPQNSSLSQSSSVVFSQFLRRTLTNFPDQVEEMRKRGELCGYILTGREPSDRLIRRQLAQLFLDDAHPTSGYVPIVSRELNILEKYPR